MAIYRTQFEEMLPIMVGAAWHNSVADQCGAVEGDDVEFAFASSFTQGGRRYSINIWVRGVVGAEGLFDIEELTYDTPSETPTDAPG